MKAAGTRATGAAASPPSPSACRGPYQGLVEIKPRREGGEGGGVRGSGSRQTDTARRAEGGEGEGASVLLCLPQGRIILSLALCGIITIFVFPDRSSLPNVHLFSSQASLVSR